MRITARSATLSCCASEFKNSEQVTLLGLKGEMLEDRKTNTNKVELNLEGYSKGIYVVRIVTEDGGATQKINLIE